MNQVFRLFPMYTIAGIPLEVLPHWQKKRKEFRLLY